MAVLLEEKRLGVPLNDCTSWGWGQARLSKTIHVINLKNNNEVVFKYEGGVAHIVTFFLLAQDYGLCSDFLCSNAHFLNSAIQKWYRWNGLFYKNLQLVGGQVVGLELLY